MCGIVGVIGKIPHGDAFKKACSALHHRGPDDGDHYQDVEDGVSLGFRRLSIIDLSQDGRQPMWSRDRRYVIIFNGEIYNYLELKEELKSVYPFRTKTDTEVLLAAYSVWGSAALSRFNGMFAFAVWDAQEKKLFCARDRLGIKPLYYSVENGVLYFASEIKALLALGVSAQPNDAVICDFLARGLYDHSSETFFDGIRRFPAGSCAVFKNGRLAIEKYWDLADISREPIEISQDDAKEKFLALFADSIRLRLRSDVPVGVNLSSGLDSASIFFFAEKLAGRGLASFTMRSRDADYDEGALLEGSLSDEQKSRWNASYLEKNELGSLVDSVLASQDEPYGGIPTIAYSKLARSARENGVTVILEGQGGDEILAGYKYYGPDFLQKIEAGGGQFSQDMSSQLQRDILRKEFVEKNLRGRPVEKPFSSALLNAQYRDIRYAKLPRVLRFNDRLSMASSCEYREPFLDCRLVEFCFFLPERFKIGPSGQKLLLREAMSDILPPSTRMRPKKAFGAMQTGWFRNYWKDPIMEIFASPSFAGRPYWDSEKVLASARQFFDGAGDNSFYLWQWVIMELWLRKFIDSPKS